MYVYALQHLAVYTICVIYKQLVLEGIPQWLKHWTGNTKVLALQFQVSGSQFIPFSFRHRLSTAHFALCKLGTLSHGHQCIILVRFFHHSHHPGGSWVCCLSSVTGDLFYFHPSHGCVEFIIIRIHLEWQLCALISSVLGKVTVKVVRSPHVACKQVKKEKGKQSHESDVSKEQGNVLIPPAPLNSHQQLYKSRRVNGFVPVPRGPQCKTGFLDWHQEPRLTCKTSI